MTQSEKNPKISAVATILLGVLITRAKSELAGTTRYQLWSGTRGGCLSQRRLAKAFAYLEVEKLRRSGLVEHSDRVREDRAEKIEKQDQPALLYRPTDEGRAALPALLQLAACDDRQRLDWLGVRQFADLITLTTATAPDHASQVIKARRASLDEERERLRTGSKGNQSPVSDWAHSLLNTLVSVEVRHLADLEEILGTNHTRAQDTRLDEPPEKEADSPTPPPTTEPTQPAPEPQDPNLARFLAVGRECDRDKR